MCECGNTINVTDTHLKSGHTTSCGCFHRKIMQDFLIKDISGQKFGKLTVLEKAYIKNGRQYWHCKCDCGKTCIAYTTSLLSGKRKSCGCLISKAEYEFWKNVTNWVNWFSKHYEYIAIAVEIENSTYNTPENELINYINDRFKLDNIDLSKFIIKEVKRTHRLKRV